MERLKWLRILEKDNEDVHRLRHGRKVGPGGAILDGFYFALEYDYEFLVTMDADFSHDLAVSVGLLAGNPG